QGRRAAEVEDDGRAAELAQPLREVFLLVADQRVRAVAAAHVELRLAARGHRDLRADGGGVLRGEEADAPATAVEQGERAFTQPRDVRDIRPHGARDLHDAGGLREAVALRDRHQLTCGNGRVRGVTATAEQDGDLLGLLPRGAVWLRGT